MTGERLDKASGLISCIGVLREKLPAATFTRVLESLDPDTRAVIEHPPMAMAWMSHEPFFKLLVACHDVAFGGKVEPLYDISREQLRRDMTTIYKVLMHLASTQTVLRKASSIYGTYSQNGAMSARELGPRSAELSIRDVAKGHPAFWEFQRGAIAGVLEVAGTKGVNVRVAAGGGHENFATWDITWK